MTLTTAKSPQFTKKTWIWQNYQIQYTVMGSGQPLVLIHGFGASIGHWRKNIPVLANAGYQVFAIDLLGFGDSEKAVIDYSMDVWVNLVKDFYDTHIQRPTIFIGNSIGALLSLIIVAKYPEIAAGGVLINSAGGLSHRPQELNPILRFIMTTFHKLVTHPVTGQFVFDRVRQKSQIRRTLYQVYSDRNTVTDELVDILYDPSCHPGAKEVFASILTAPPGPTPDELLPKVTSPLLVIWGENDPWTPISGAKIYENARENGQNIQVIPIPNAGHCPHDEVPEIVNQQILNWCNNLGFNN
ncbi:alpha/beta fold hydrolase [Anabaena sp. FACHB-1237]|uniref:alpha/beta fold hydrolase n=1 Tax=Anabaena sp. FACHB-1237 TaxID=2692769 RepID=UPI00168093A3|nr:alpha/beta fold hydrolase [Anabaena sp. FACHB-1237]MBD2139257.1 alpha/beta fold hydrolase [Anabaena sp. FACHB-1237]